MKMNIQTAYICPFRQDLPPAPPSYHRFLESYFSAENQANCAEECATQICALMHFFDPKCAGESDICTRCANPFLREKIDRFVRFVENESIDEAIKFAERIGDPAHAKGAVLAAQQLILWAGIIDRLG